MITEWLVQLHHYQLATFPNWGGAYWFLLESLLLAVVICKWGIPLTTDMMVNASAGLAGKHVGPKSRTLVINASTNNPELANMLVWIGLGRAGGIANPLGSNLANIYLMYLVAPMWLIVRWTLGGQRHRAKALAALLLKERRLVVSHVLMALIMFTFASIAYWFMTGEHQFERQSGGASLQPWHLLMIGGGVCLVGVLSFRAWDQFMKRRHPNLFEDIHDEAHSESWLTLIVGTGGLIVVSFALNELFLSWSEIYQSALSGVFGATIFASLHYFVGALVTSLPELRVAMDNYEKFSSPDLNTALSSASVSNMTNLAIATLGILLVGLLGALGMHLVL